MKPMAMNLPLSKTTSIPCEMELTRHKNKSETLRCRITLDGKPVELVAKLLPPKCRGNHMADKWLLKCHGWQTGSTTKDKYKTAAYLFRTNIEIINSWIEASKYEEVNVRIPKEGGCEKCPLYAVGREWCNYFGIKIENAQKNINCPARQKND